MACILHLHRAAIKLQIYALESFIPAGYVLCESLKSVSARATPPRLYLSVKLVHIYGLQKVSTTLLGIMLNAIHARKRNCIATVAQAKARPAFGCKMGSEIWVACRRPN